ncbi:MAG: class I SAM-dependent methyltransferase [Nocardioides sp.]
MTTQTLVGPTLGTTGTWAERWPGLADVPEGPRTAFSAAVARRIFEAGVRRLAVTVHLEGRILGTGGPEMTIHRPDEFFARLGRGVLIGFGEAYLTGAWSADDLGGFLTVLARDMPTLVPKPLQKLRTVAVMRPPHHQVSTQENSRSNIAHHYDLSNDLFEAFLDPTMSYSSGLFDYDDLDLRNAQARKIERLLDVTDVGPGTRVLEIGTGWGELAIRAARRGATVRSITLSSEQQALARERIAEAGYADRVSVDLLDYRALAGDTTYDAVLSVEMIEAVGYDFWPDYFETLDRVLAPRGKVGIQAITMSDHNRMLATRTTYTWINKYIFPGGFLPSVQVIDEITRARTGLRICDRHGFGSHYAETLRQWDETFLASHDRVLELGFDETFIRMWHFYLEYSRAGFASGYIDVEQIVLER